MNGRSWAALTLVGLASVGCATSNGSPAADVEQQKVALLRADPVLNEDVPAATPGKLLASGGHGGDRSVSARAFRTWTSREDGVTVFVAALGRARAAGARLDRVTCSGGTFIAGGLKPVGSYVASITVSVERGTTPTLQVQLSIGGGDDAALLPMPSASPYTDPGCAAAIRAAAHD